MPDKFDTILMIIYKITPFVDYIFWLKRLDTQLNESTNQNSIKVPNVVESTNIYKTLGTSVIYNPMSPSSLGSHLSL